jgi:hypothetical protein
MPAERRMRVIPMRRPEEVDEVGCAMLFLASDESSYITGCGGLRLHPAVGEGCRRWRGTGSSNPSSSSGESGANLNFGIDDLHCPQGRHRRSSTVPAL